MKLRVLGAALALLLVSACGGGGGDNGMSVPNARQGGIYTGTVSPNGQPSQDVQIALVTETGETKLVTNVGTVFAAQLNTNGNTIAGNFTGFCQGCVFGNGRSTTTGMVAGSVAERSSIAANYTAEAGDRGAVALSYNALYNQPSSLATLAGTFGYTEGNYTVTYTVTNTGAVTGSDTNGCNYNGNFSLVNPSFNLYRLSATDSCNASAGTFSGLAAYQARTAATADRIFFVVTSANASFSDVVDRK